MEIKTPLANLCNIQPAQIQAAQKKHAPVPQSGIKNPLRPLDKDTLTIKQDTVEISSSAAKRIDHSDRCSVNLTQKLSDEADFAYDKFKSTLRDIFPKTDIIDRNSYMAKSRMHNALSENQDKPVIMITTRKKTPASISEKMAQKHIRNKSDAKEQINDIIGARIIVSGTGAESGNYVIERLTDAVKKNKIKIIAVKNHGQDDTKLNYASKKKIEKLVQTAKKHGSPNCEYLDQQRDTGYLGLHIITDSIADGYKAEIQIMGVDVENFKNIEDLCYKCFANKGVAPRYSRIKSLFEPMKKDERLKADFAEYTKRAYAYERQKSDHKNINTSSHLHIPKDLDIPKRFDFNNIARIKKAIDLGVYGEPTISYAL